jgi:hypothetical protein
MLSLWLRCANATTSCKRKPSKKSIKRQNKVTICSHYHTVVILLRPEHHEHNGRNNNGHDAANVGSRKEGAMHWTHLVFLFGRGAVKNLLFSTVFWPDPRNLAH